MYRIQRDSGSSSIEMQALTEERDEQPGPNDVEGKDIGDTEEHVEDNDDDNDPVTEPLRRNTQQRTSGKHVDDDLYEHYEHEH